MRTTLDIEDDLLAAAKALAQRQGKTTGQVISELARRGLNAGPGIVTSDVAESAAFYGFEPLPDRGVVVTDALIDRLRDETGA
ncbi:MAG TPA: antitoxin [Xanthomonadales bacterium]|nr:antitoxin [Xanthomonadales bacterium]